jgi:hypothetical protein
LRELSAKKKPEPKASHALRFGLFGTYQVDKVPGSVIGIAVQAIQQQDGIFTGVHLKIM